MKVTLEEGKPAIDVAKMSLDDWRSFMAQFMTHNTNASAAWDIMGCVRGPDAGLGVLSERPNMESSEHSAVYTKRRERKYDTVEIIRKAMFFGAMGGAARSHKGDTVTLPPSGAWDHFDKNVARAARALGLKIKEKKA